jgi:hypothetical protein
LRAGDCDHKAQPAQVAFDIFTEKNQKGNIVEQIVPVGMQKKRSQDG